MKKIYNYASISRISSKKIAFQKAHTKHLIKKSKTRGRKKMKKNIYASISRISSKKIAFQKAHTKHLMKKIENEGRKKNEKKI